MLGGVEAGFVYQRDGHPNADVLAEKCRRLHGAAHAAVTSSGMSALSLAMLAFLKPGDHVLLSSRLYGKTVSLVGQEGSRWGIVTTQVDMLDPARVQQAVTPRTRMIIVETISNPTLQVVDIGALAAVGKAAGALLLVDNTFASPAVCQPLKLGADLVLESLTKIMNGHSDVVLGLLCGSQSVDWTRVPGVLGCWGMTSCPWACWVCERGLMTLPVRLQAACRTAAEVATGLRNHPQLRGIDYPGLEGHPQHRIARNQFLPAGDPMFGHVVTFHLKGGLQAATRWMAELEGIEYCTSLGEAATTLSHPASSSHRACTAGELSAAGIDGGTIRLSAGLESPEFVLESLKLALARLD